MKTVFLHIGTHKTGSTALQQALSANRLEIADAGFDYSPHIVPKIVRQLLGSADDQPRRGVLGDFVNQSPRPTIIISSEGLSGNPLAGYSDTPSIAARCQDELQDVQCKVVVYLRPQAEFIGSLYSQHIHEGNHSNVSDFLNTLPLEQICWKTLCDIYIEAFGKENVIVRPYTYETLHRHDIVQDFARIAHIPPSCFKHPAIRTNKSYSRAALLFAKAINSHLSPKEQQEMRFMLQTCNQKEFGEHGSFIPRTKRAEIMSMHEAGNRTIAEQHWTPEETDAFFKPDESQEFSEEFSMEDLALVLYRNQQWIRKNACDGVSIGSLWKAALKSSLDDLKFKIKGIRQRFGFFRG